MDYFTKYKKYKSKYLQLKLEFTGGTKLNLEKIKLKKYSITIEKIEIKKTISEMIEELIKLESELTPIKIEENIHADKIPKIIYKCLNFNIKINYKEKNEFKINQKEEDNTGSIFKYEIKDNPPTNFWKKISNYFDIDVNTELHFWYMIKFPKDWLIDIKYYDNNKNMYTLVYKYKGIPYFEIFIKKVDTSTNGRSYFQTILSYKILNMEDKNILKYEPNYTEDNIEYYIKLLESEYIFIIDKIKQQIFDNFNKDKLKIYRNTQLNPKDKLKTVSINDFTLEQLRAAVSS